jgi:hypothetical protein
MGLHSSTEKADDDVKLPLAYLRAAAGDPSRRPVGQKSILAISNTPSDPKSEQLLFTSETTSDRNVWWLAVQVRKNDEPFIVSASHGITSGLSAIHISFVLIRE